MSNRVLSLPLSRFDHHVKKGRCRNYDRCGNKIKKPRRYYCSKLCSGYLFSISNWSTLRQIVLERDDHTCQVRKCRYRNPGKMEVDHIKPIGLGGDPLDPDNCQTLCPNHHKIKTKNDVRWIHHKKKQALRKKLQMERQLRRRQWGQFRLRF